MGNSKFLFSKRLLNQCSAAKNGEYYYWICWTFPESQRYEVWNKIYKQLLFSAVPFVPQVSLIKLPVSQPAVSLGVFEAAPVACPRLIWRPPAHLVMLWCSMEDLKKDDSRSCLPQSEGLVAINFQGVYLRLVPAVGLLTKCSSDATTVNSVWGSCCPQKGTGWNPIMWYSRTISESMRKSQESINNPVHISVNILFQIRRAIKITQVV